MRIVAGKLGVIEDTLSKENISKIELKHLPTCDAPPQTRRSRDIE